MKRREGQASVKPMRDFNYCVSIPIDLEGANSKSFFFLSEVRHGSASTPKLVQLKYPKCILRRMLRTEIEEFGSYVIIVHPKTKS
jgi:hypothetical protein